MSKRNASVVGQRFGKWTVLVQYLPKGRCLAKCDCGIEKEVRLSHLTHGFSTSCHCGRAPESRPFNRWLVIYKYNAKRRELEWGLTDEEARQLYDGNCGYCGTVGPNGIDRLCSDSGYLVGNVTSCCTTCNYMKRELNRTNFEAHVKKIVQHLEK